MKHERVPLYDALNAAANGFSVIPADARTGEPLLDIGKASTDPEIIRAWWDQYPGAQPACMAPKPKELKATPYVWREPASIPRREFLYGLASFKRDGKVLPLPSVLDLDPGRRTHAKP